MIHTVRKAYLDFEKEEKWLNEMAAKGFALVEYTFCKYSFETCEPGEYQYRIELLENLPSHPESMQYIRFMEENGVELVCTYIRWVYFRAKKSELPFQIYSDTDSRIAHIKRIRALWLACLFVMYIGVGINLAFGISHLIEDGAASINLFLGITLSPMLLAINLHYIIYGKMLRRLNREKNILE